jgi:hypothetical protein
MNANHEDKGDDYVDFDLGEEEKNGDTHAENFKQG